MIEEMLGGLHQSDDVTGLSAQVNGERKSISVSTQRFRADAAVCPTEKSTAQVDQKRKKTLLTTAGLVRDTPLTRMWMATFRRFRKDGHSLIANLYPGRCCSVEGSAVVHSSAYPAVSYRLIVIHTVVDRLESAQVH